MLTFVESGCWAVWRYMFVRVFFASLCWWTWINQEKSTHERIVSAWFSISGTQDVSVAAERLLLVLSVRSLGTQESGGYTDFLFANILTSTHFVRFLSVASGPFVSKLTCPWTNIQTASRGCQYIQKKHSKMLCFLVAGRRIELRTSWLWIHLEWNLWKMPK